MAWHKIIALGLLASAAFAGCTVTTDDPEGDGGGSGGSENTGGKASTGGKAATGGASSSGGNKATGGTQTEDAGDVCTKPANECDGCVKSKCCEEYKDCGDDAACSQKDNDQGELLCIQSCLIDQVGDAAVVDLDECASRCAVESSGVSAATSALIACIRTPGEAPGDGGAALQNCSTVCFGAELPE
jgi:hypothetical protein